MNTTNSISTIANSCAGKIFLAGLYREPFKHIVVDNFLPESLLTQCRLDFPDPQYHLDQWESEDCDVEKKYRTIYTSEFDFPGALNVATRILNSSMVLKAMSQVMEIPKLIPDPYYTGGGLNYMTDGGVLDVHIDGNYHDTMGLHRRLNAILFLGGQGDLGFFDSTGDNLIKSISPHKNRLVLFNTHDKSFHGVVTEPLQRRSLILYYYTSAEREHVTIKDPHRALWKSKNVTDKNGKKVK